MQVSGNITIEWEWMTKTDQLKIDKWIPLLRKLTFEDERRLSFVRQEVILSFFLFLFICLFFIFLSFVSPSF